MEEPAVPVVEVEVEAEVEDWSRPNGWNRPGGLPDNGRTFSAQQPPPRSRAVAPFDIPIVPGDNQLRRARQKLVRGGVELLVARVDRWVSLSQNSVLQNENPSELTGTTEPGTRHTSSSGIPNPEAARRHATPTPHGW